jgi:uncharacterized membrane protein YphA (DoxX/SURF4 family)
VIVANVGNGHVHPRAEQRLGDAQADAAGPPVTSAVLPGRSCMVPLRFPPAFAIRFIGAGAGLRPFVFALPIHQREIVCKTNNAPAKMALHQSGPPGEESDGGCSPTMTGAPEGSESKAEEGAPNGAGPRPHRPGLRCLPSSLATFLNFFDQTVFGMLAQRIKQDFALSDEALGFLGGPASVIFFVVVGIPLARLADIYPRRLVLAGGMLATATIMALGGMAQTFGQFVGSRMFLGAGGSAHAPASYSLLADFFPPKKITRAFAVLQLGFIGGTTVGVRWAAN